MTLLWNQASTSQVIAERNDPDVQGLQRVYQENLDLIYRYVYSRVGNREDAEDLTSLVFLKAMREVDCGCAPRMIRHWLFQVARTTLADHWRERYRLLTCSLDELLERDREGSGEEELPIRNRKVADCLRHLLLHLSTCSPEEIFDAEREGAGGEKPTAGPASAADRVQRLLQALPVRYREVLTCRFLLNLSIRDTALRLGLTEANVKVVQFRALRRAADLEGIVLG
jgi:RNA polymerase sigma-70 factor (ECF subfamily)